MATETTSGIGQGLAQVLDDSRSYGEFVKGRDRALNLALDQKKKKDADRNKLFTSVGKTLEAETWFRDAPFFQGEAQKIKDYTELHLDAILNNDPGATLELETMMGNYLTSAKDSKDAREYFETVAAKLEGDKEGKYDQEASYQNLQNVAKGDPGDYGFIGQPLLVGKSKDVDLLEDYRKNVLPILKSQGETDTTFRLDDNTGGIVHTTVSGTPSESVEMTLRSRATNPEVFAQIEKDFNQLKESEKIKFEDPVDWYVNSFTELGPGEKRQQRLTGANGKGGIDFNFGGATTDKFRFSFKGEEFKRRGIVQPIGGRFQQPPDTIGTKKIVDINTLSKSGELGSLVLPIGGREVKGTVTEVSQEPGSKWRVKFKADEQVGEKYRKGQVIELDYESVKQDIIGKYGADIPQLWEEHQSQFGDQQEKDKDADEGPAPIQPQTFDHSNLN